GEGFIDVALISVPPGEIVSSPLGCVTTVTAAPRVVCPGGIRQERSAATARPAPKRKPIPRVRRSARVLIWLLPLGVWGGGPSRARRLPALTGARARMARAADR